jgi:hypothetical protein
VLRRVWSFRRHDPRTDWRFPFKLSKRGANVSKRIVPRGARGEICGTTTQPAWRGRQEADTLPSERGRCSAKSVGSCSQKPEATCDGSITWLAGRLGSCPPPHTPLRGPPAEATAGGWIGRGADDDVDNSTDLLISADLCWPWYQI